MPFANIIRDSTLYSIVASVVLLFLVLAARSVLSQVILRNVDQSEARLKWLVTLRNVLLLFLLGGIVAIWAQEIKTFALSLVAIAAAFVLATKELIQCVSGYLIRTTGSAYDIGDRIEIGNYRGEVIDHNMLTTTLIEIGPGRAFHMHTGRTIVVPNSLLITAPVVNESALEQYVVHVFSIPIRVDEDWARAEQILLDAAQAECTPFLDDARRHMRALERRHGISSPSVDPRIAATIPEPGRLSLLVRVPAPIGRQGRIEQAILRRFLAEFYRTPVPPQQPAA
jgi:small-conductance mechanosensitive channel